MVRANLCVAAAGLCMGAARAVLVDGPAAARHWGRGEDRLQYFVLRRHPGASHVGRPVRDHNGHVDRGDDAAHTRSVAGQPGPVDRARNHGGVPGGSGPVAPRSRANLICGPIASGPDHS